MPPIYPDLTWYKALSDQNGLLGRCPYAGILLCPRHFESAALLSDAGTTARIPKKLYDAALAKWSGHDLAAATSETAPSISSRSYSNFCPEVAYDTFHLFAVTLILNGDDPVDRMITERLIEKDPASPGKDWRWMWSHIEPLHYSGCPLYSKLHQEKPVSNITFNGPVTGNINVAGHDISAPVMSLSLAEIITKIDTSPAPLREKEAAKSKLGEFLQHPVVAAIIGGLAGKIVG